MKRPFCLAFLVFFILIAQNSNYACLIDPNLSYGKPGFESFNLGRQYYQDKDYERAEEQFIKTLNICKKPHIKHTFPYNENFRMSMYMDSNQHDHLYAIYRYTHHYLGQINFDAGDYEQAFFHFSLAIGGFCYNKLTNRECYVDERCFGSAILTDPSWLIEYGICGIACGDFAEAGDFFSCVSGLIEAFFHLLHPDPWDWNYLWMIDPGKKNLNWLYPWLIVALNNEGLAAHLKAKNSRSNESFGHRSAILATSAAIDIHENRNNEYLDVQKIVSGWVYNDNVWYYDKTCQLNSDHTPDPTMYSNRGFYFFELEYYDNALKDFSKVIELTPSEPDGYLNRAMVYLHLEKFSEAIQDYNHAIELDPDNPEIYQLRGAAFFLSNFPDFGQADLEKSCFLEQSQVCNDNDQGFNAYAAGNYGRALCFFSKFTETYPDNAIGYLNKGKTYYALNQFEYAIDDFNTGLELDPQNWQIYQERGLAYLALSDFDSAEKDFLEALNLLPNNSIVYQNLGTTYFSIGAFQDAVDNYEKALSCGFGLDQQSVYRSLGIAYYEMKNYRKAIPYFDSAVKLGCEDSLLHLLKGLSLFEEKHYNQAIDSYTYLITLDPNNTQAYLHRGKAYYYNHEFQKAVEDFNKVISNNSSDPIPYRFRGLSHLCLSLEDDAFKDFLHAIELEKPQITHPINLQTFTSSMHMRGNLIEKHGRLYSLDRAKMYPFASFEFQSLLPDDFIPIHTYVEINSFEFSKGLTKGVFQGGVACVQELGPFAYNLLFHPIQTTEDVINSLNLLTQYILSQQWGEIAQVLMPELRELYLKGNQLSDIQKGELAGIAIGKYGIGVLTGIGAIKLVKTIKHAAIHSKVGELVGIKKVKTIIEPVALPSYPPVYPEGTWILPMRGAAIIGKRYYTEHALARMAPKNNFEVIARLDNRFWVEAKKRGFSRTKEGRLAFLKTEDGGSFRVDPRGIPPMVVEAEIANPGCTEWIVKVEDGKVVTILPRD